MDKLNYSEFLINDCRYFQLSSDTPACILGKQITIPSGFISDGCSAPKALWRILSS